MFLGQDEMQILKDDHGNIDKVRIQKEYHLHLLYLLQINYLY